MVAGEASDFAEEDGPADAPGIPVCILRLPVHAEKSVVETCYTLFVTLRHDYTHQTMCMHC